jgi:hypothetical protein
MQNYCVSLPSKVQFSRSSSRVTVLFVLQERRKKEREVEEKRLAAERAAEDERRRTAEVRTAAAAARVSIATVLADYGMFLSQQPTSKTMS